jgi:hypothetical protein
LSYCIQQGSGSRRKDTPPNVSRRDACRSSTSTLRVPALRRAALRGGRRQWYACCVVHDRVSQLTWWRCRRRACREGSLGTTCPRSPWVETSFFAAQVRPRRPGQRFHSEVTWICDVARPCAAGCDRVLGRGGQDRPARPALAQGRHAAGARAAPAALIHDVARLLLRGRGVTAHRVLRVTMCVVSYAGLVSLRRSCTA